MGYRTRPKRKLSALPEGGHSLDQLKKIGEVYLNRALDEHGIEGLDQIAGHFAEGQLIEAEGRLKEARQKYEALLLQYPDNLWLKAAISRISANLQ